MPGWLAMIIYTTPDDSVDDIWTKKGLISVRNFEARAKDRDGSIGANAKDYLSFSTMKSTDCFRAR